MMNEAIKEKPSVSDILSYKEHIEPYHFVQIFAGTCSGKNYFIEKIASENNFSVGIFTSRRTKVEQSLVQYKNDSTYSRFLNYHDDEDLELEFKQLYGIELLKNNPYDTTITTYGMMNYYYHNEYNDEDTASRPENCNDLIVVDEAHAVILDSTFQDSTFYIEQLIFRIINNFVNNIPMRCKHLIIMTGTPSIVDEYFNQSGLAKTYDLMDICKCIYPKHILFTDTARVKNIISNLVSKGKKVVYFSNYVLFVDDFIKGTKIKKSEAISICSNKEKIEIMKTLNKNAEKEINDFHTNIVTKKVFTPGINLLLVTSKYREGIDIEDDIDAIFIEQHCGCEIVQMAGRIRNQVDKAYIIVDARQHGIKESEERSLLEFAYSIIDSVNSTLKTKTNKKEKDEWIKIVQRQSPYIMYEPVEDIFKIFIAKNKAYEII